MTETTTREPEPVDRRKHPLTGGALAKALAEAQERCKPVGKDGFNKHHKYAYASVEAVYTQAREALAGTGLALVPTVSRVEVRTAPTCPPAKWEREQGAQHDPMAVVPTMVLIREFDLIHTSGESRTLAMEWGFALEAGRPIDKAIAGAMTSSLSYLYRDLLSMPRVHARDDMNSDERDADVIAAEAFEKAQAAKKQAPQPRSQNAGSFKRPDAQPSPSMPVSEGRSLEVIARGFGPAALDAMHGPIDELLEVAHVNAFLAEVGMKVGHQHPLVARFKKPATVGSARELIGAVSRLVPAGPVDLDDLPDEDRGGGA